MKILGPSNDGLMPHNSTCILGKLNKMFSDRILLCGDIDLNLSEQLRSRGGTANRDLLLSGDIELNPGPPRRSMAEKGPTTDEKISSIEATLSTYEAKIAGLEQEMETQKSSYEKNLGQLSSQIGALEQRLDTLSSDFDTRREEDQANVKDVLDIFQEGQNVKFDDISSRVDGFLTQVSSDMERNEERLGSMAERLTANESVLHDLQSNQSEKMDHLIDDTRKHRELITRLEARIKDRNDMKSDISNKVEYTGKIHEIAHVTREQRREYKSKFLDMDTEYSRLRERMEIMNQMLDDIQEKMYEFEQNKKNNLIFHGVVADHPESTEGLTHKIAGLVKSHINIKRDLPVVKASRVFTGPEVRGTRPVLVTFENFKDRDEVLRKARMLKRANIHIEEDLSKRTREARNELRKYMRQIRRANPERNCFLQFDKLYVDNKVYVYNDVLGQVVEHTESVRMGEMMSRPGSAMMGGFGVGMFGPSRPGSRTGSRPASGLASRDRDSNSNSSIPKLPPLNKQHSYSLPSIQDFVDPREVKMNEMEKVIHQYQEKLQEVTSNYQQKIGILETKIIEKEMDREFTNGPEDGGYLDISSDLSDSSPERQPRGHHSKNIAVIREEEGESDEELELARLNGK